jgi:hypothetical protein
MWDSFVVYNQISGQLRRAVIARDEAPIAIEDAVARANATREAISYAMYGLLRHRFAKSPNAATLNALFDATMARLGYDIARAKDVAPSDPPEPHRVGNRVAFAVIDAGLKDNSCEATDYDCPVGHPHHYTPVNRFPLNPYWNGPGAVENPNRWQSLEIGQFIDQAGVAINGYPPFTGPQWGFVTPFALDSNDHATRSDGSPRDDMPAAFDGVYFDPGSPPLWGANSSTDAEYKGNFTLVLKVSGMLSPNDGIEVDTSPRNSTFGSNNFFALNKCDLTPNEPCRNIGVGFAFNPATGEPYEPNVVYRGDYTRVLAEFWADGPQSETPPGHWNTILNGLFDHPAFEYRWGGAGAEMDATEYQARAYLALNAAMHDAAVAAWGIKFRYDYVRPLTAIRFMASLGQSSNRSGPSYHPGGIPLVEGHTRVVLPEDICTANCDLETGFTPGSLWQLGRNAIGQVLGRAWDSLSFHCNGVCWYPGQDWKTYQRPSFVTPPFAGYISGHSTFSRTAADTLTRVTGSAFFPGGLGRFVALGGAEAIANGTDFLVFEHGPSRTVELEWATYGDASDECSLSRIYGGIHPPADDLPGRHVGRRVAARAWRKLVDEVFGPVSGTRAAVRVRLGSADVLAKRFGSEKAALIWARQRALAAHDRAVAAAAQAVVYNGVTARLLPRQPNEAPNERTLMLLGAHPNAGAELAADLEHDPDVVSCQQLVCDSLQCVPIEDDSVTVLPGGSIAIIVLALLLFFVFVGLLAGYLYRRKQKKNVQKA